MYCSSCGKELVELSPNFCSSCGKRIQEMCVGGTPQSSTQTAIPPCPTPAFSTFLEYRQKKKEERQKYSLGRRDLKHKGKTKVKINVGLMVIQKGDLRPQRGKTISLTTDPDISATTLLSQAVKKMKDFNKDVKDGPFLLLYPDGTEVINIPGTQRPFALGAYKAEVGKPYQRITFFICLKRDFEEVGNLSDLSDSDPEIVIKKSSEFDLADTLAWEPLDESSPLQQVAETENYTNLFEPIVIDDEDDVEDLTRDKEKDLPTEEPVETNVQAHEIIAHLALAIDHKKVSRFNICRSDVWDGAVRGFQRSTYSDNNDMFIKFNDDAGCLEEGLDTGGPRREFLTLLMSHLRNRPIFDGPPENRYLVCNSRDPGSRIRGKNVILQNSTMFQTAGCLRGVKTCEKQAFVEEYLRWYIIDRNHSAIERFKDGLASLGFLPALQQHSSVLSPVLCFSAKALTASDLETMFRPDLSPTGSNRRQKEGKTLGFWADYLLDSEGLAALPPAGIMPPPRLEFLSDSPFPVANTCANTLKLPLLESYSVFKENMDFGIQNAPGFGCY
ncbi:hypothetical protein MHYP_G00029940 [Metynnis hypsauchen]